MKIQVPSLSDFVSSNPSHQCLHCLAEESKNAGWPKVLAASGIQHSVMLLDPEVVKFVFHTKFTSFKKGDRISEIMGELLGDGIFLSDPPQWKMHRKVASRMFSMRNLKTYMFDCTVDHTKQVIAKINSNDAFLEDVDIYNMLSRFTLDCFTAIAFGKSVDSTSFYPEKHPFAEAFDNCIENFTFRHVTPPVLSKFRSTLKMNHFMYSIGTYTVDMDAAEVVTLRDWKRRADQTGYSYH